MPRSDRDLIDQFNTSCLPEYQPPPSFNGSRFQIRNDYPAISHKDDYPWLAIDFEEEPKKYSEELLKYCFDGMPESDFVVQNNQKRQWYHAPWMHYHGSGREPLHGLTYERPTPPKELAITQTSWLQMWACAYYNSLAATVFGGIWANPAHPTWDDDIRFPTGSVIFKVLMTDAADDELPFMKGSPEWKAFIAQQPEGDGPPLPEKRNTVPSTVRLLQVDIAARDERAQTGWTFGSFIYDGRYLASDIHLHEPDRWYNLIPVGIMWGNDPDLTQAEFGKGKRPVEHWINPAADELLSQLRGERPAWGWNGRMNGPADDFVSACSSCHSVAQKIATSDVKKDKFARLVPPVPNKNLQGEWIPRNDAVTMKWFRNLKDERFNPEAASADYSLQLMMGFLNYERFQNGLEPATSPSRSGRVTKSR